MSESYADTYKESRVSQSANTDNELVESIKLEALKMPSSFNLSARNLTKIPEEIGLLTSLDRLRLNNNKLSSLPIELLNLAALRYLNLKGNNLKEFPPVLMQLPSLEVLDMSRNNLTRFPIDFGLLIQLRVRQQIPFVDAQKVLSISYNEIRELPKYFSQMKRLEHFRLDNNPISWPPSNVIVCEQKKDQKSWLVSLKSYILDNGPPYSTRVNRKNSRSNSATYSFSEYLTGDVSSDVNDNYFEERSQAAGEDKSVEAVKIPISPVMSPSAPAVKSCQELLHLFMARYQPIIETLILKYPYIDSFLSILFGSVQIHAVASYMNLLVEKLAGDSNANFDASFFEKIMGSINYLSLVLIKYLKGFLAENNISSDESDSLKRDIKDLISDTKLLIQICQSSLLSIMQSQNHTIDLRILNGIISNWINANNFFSEAITLLNGGQKKISLHQGEPILQSSMSSSAPDIFLNLYSLLESLEKKEASHLPPHTRKLLVKSLQYCDTKDVILFLDTLSDFLAECRKIEKKSISQACLPITALAQSLIKIAEV